MTAPFELPVLRDELVSLRPFRESDAHALVEIWRDPDIRRRNSVPEPAVAAARAWIARSAHTAEEGTAWEWAVVDLSTNALAGRRVMKVDAGDPRRVNAGAWIAPEFRGRGYAPRSVRLAAAYLFSQGVSRVQGACEADNLASQRNLERAGTTFEGRLRPYFASRDGGRSDALMFSLLPEDLA